MPESRFDTYFHERSRRFSRFYRSERVARALGRGPLFDRLRYAVDKAVDTSSKHVLDVGCGSGPLFAPLVQHGIRVTGIEPADGMFELAQAEERRLGDLVVVQKRGWEDLTDADQFDLAAAPGVFDYVDDADALLRRLAGSARYVVGSFPTPGLRTELRKIRYGRKGVRVHGTTAAGLVQLAARNGLHVADLHQLGRAGYAVLFARR
jgi:SAM-dependent methyltransferase